MLPEIFLGGMCAEIRVSLARFTEGRLLTKLRMKKGDPQTALKMVIFMRVIPWGTYTH